MTVVSLAQCRRLRNADSTVRNYAVACADMDAALQDLMDATAFLAMIPNLPCDVRQQNDENRRILAGLSLLNAALAKAPDPAFADPGFHGRIAELVQTLRAVRCTP